jgi:hypothetical protein
LYNSPRLASFLNLPPVGMSTTIEEVEIEVDAVRVSNPFEYNVSNSQSWGLHLSHVLIKMSLQRE